MSNDFQLKAYDVYAEESRSFDYYVTGAAGATLAYALQALHRVSPYVDFLIPVSWALLLVATASGVVHLAAKVSAHTINAAQLGLESQRRDVFAAAQRGLDAEFGDVIITPQLAPLAMEQFARLKDESRKRLKAVQRRGVRAWILRTWALGAGVLALAALKFAAWYLGAI
jgi:hypothetical protein